MKNAILGLMAATLLATPALASWKTELFGRLDVDKSNELSVKELETGGCTVHIKFFKYADDNRSGGLSRPEFFNNRDLFGRCK
jgi:hypothetical protein